MNDISAVYLGNVKNVEKETIDEQKRVEHSYTTGLDKWTKAGFRFLFC